MKSRRLGARNSVRDCRLTFTRRPAADITKRQTHETRGRGIRSWCDRTFMDRAGLTGTPKRRGPGADSCRRLGQVIFVSESESKASGDHDGAWSTHLAHEPGRREARVRERQGNVTGIERVVQEVPASRSDQRDP